MRFVCINSLMNGLVTVCVRADEEKRTRFIYIVATSVAAAVALLILVIATVVRCRRNRQ